MKPPVLSLDAYSLLRVWESLRFWRRMLNRCPGLWLKRVEEVEGFPVGIDGEALVAAVGALIVAFRSKRLPKSHMLEFLPERSKWSLRRRYFHFGSDGGSGPESSGESGEGLKDFRKGRGRRDGLSVGRRVGDDSGIGDEFHGELVIGKDLDQLLADFFRGMSGKDSAIDYGLRCLGQGIVGVAGTVSRVATQVVLSCWS